MITNPALEKGITFIQMRNWNFAYSTFKQILENKLLELESVFGF